MLLLHALLFSLLAMSVLAIPVTPVTAPTEEAAKSSVGGFRGTIKKIFLGEPDRIDGYWYVEAKVVSEHRSFNLTRY